MAERVRRELLRLHAAASRLGELFLERPTTSLGVAERKVLGGLAESVAGRTRQVLLQLADLVREAPVKEVARAR